MKDLIVAAVLALLAGGSGKAETLWGTVSDNNGQPVEFATVVALADSVQRGGAVTDSIGHYRMTLPDGSYTLHASAVGYETAEQPFTLKGDSRIDLTLTASGILINEVNVEASAIRREADRFVMNVEDMPSTVGQDGKELLQQAPGVWIDNEKISLNGKSGTKIYVNDREIKLSNEQLLAFLQSLKAENVSRIEIVPQTGVEYSADTNAGIIKITLKKNRADGVMGNVSMSGSMGESEAFLSPSATVNVQAGKWSFNLNGNYSHALKLERNVFDNISYDSGMSYNASTLMNARKLRTGSLLAGIFYDADPRNSFGLELNYSRYYKPVMLTTDGTFDRLTQLEKLNGNYQQRNLSDNIDATFNYIHRLDTLGSTLKVIANYTRADENQKMNNLRHTVVDEQLSDSISRSDENSLFDVANLSLDWEKIVNPKWTVGAGAKYTFNQMNSGAFYEYQKADAWLPETARNYSERYRENIAAVYVKAAANFSHVSVSAGLRGEYTDGSSHGKIVEQSYFDLFPNASVTYRLDEQGSNSLTANYARHITRPSFWALNPVRAQSSDYTYQTGNPYLRPSHNNNVSLTGVYNYRYSLNVWADINQDPIMQGAMTDPQNPDNALLGQVNADTQYSFGAMLTLPFQFTKWWSLNTNLMYMYLSDRMTAEAPLQHSNLVMVNVNTIFNLPLDFYLTASYMYQSKARFGNMELQPLSFLNASLKKTFDDRRWTVAFNANNLLNASFDFTTRTDGYRNATKMRNPSSFVLSVTYNFNSGKMFQTKRIENNADESRLQKSSGVGSGN